MLSLICHAFVLRSLPRDPFPRKGLRGVICSSKRNHIPNEQFSDAAHTAAASEKLSPFKRKLAVLIVLVPIAMMLLENVIGVKMYLTSCIGAAVVGVITASCVSIMTPMAAPCQIMIIEPGGYTLKDYLKCGTPLALILIVVSVFFLPTLYPFA